MATAEGSARKVCGLRAVSLVIRPETVLEFIVLKVVE